MRGFRLLWAALGLAFVAGSPLQAQPKSPPSPVVPGYERLFAEDKVDLAVGGQLLLTELSCVNCHTTEGGSAFLQRQGPTLTDVGSRIKRSFIKKFIADPHAVKPGTAMPNVLAGLPEEEKKDAIEALTHYLASTGTPKQERPDGKQVGMGGDLYAKVGCVICHGVRDGSGKMTMMISTHAPKVDLKSKYTIATLAAFLENPHGARPAGRMPGLLDGKEAKAVANYLLQGIPFAGSPARTDKGSTTYSLYEGTWPNVPDFSKEKAKTTGTGAAFDLGLSSIRSNYGMVFTGLLEAETDGNYSFHLASDDGSRLLVDGKVVVNNDGVHPKTLQSGSKNLKKGIHKVEVQYFQGGGEDELEVEFEGPTVSRQPLGNWVAANEAGLKKGTPKVVEQPAKADDESYPLDNALVTKGKALFGSLGCVNCHTGKDAPKAAAAAPIAKLKAEGGCLADAPTKGIPFFGLNARQKASIVAALKANPAKRPETETAAIHRTMAAFNCVACHIRDKVGGVEEAMNKHFITTQPEMGDEARVPPWLDGVGSKMNPAYLDKILDKGVRDRTYMLVRMPRFGASNVGHLSKDFRSEDKGKVEAAPDVKYATTPARVKSAGRHLVGAQAFGCIKCHTFAGKKAEGTQGIDMAVMAERVTRDWFHAYLLDPVKIRPGTRMPAAWPKGDVFLPQVLDGKAATQIDSIWRYLSDGGGAALPLGMKKSAIVLVPEKTAIIYRNFIEGAGARAIGVGYPEKANLAFDANELRLAMVWQGAFMDAARHWTDRGVGYEPPLGDNVVKLPPGSAFARLESGTAAWPGKSAKELGARFKGYRLDKEDRPTFLYSFGDVSIEDQPNAVPEKDSIHIRRTLNFSSEKDVSDLYFRVVAGNKIEAIGNGWYRINNDWRVKIEGGEPQVRPAGAGSELIIRVPLQGGKARIVEEFGW